MPALLAVLVIALLAAAPAASAKEPSLVRCGDRIEGAGPTPRADGARDITRGLLTLLGARRLQRDPSLARGPQVRVGVMLDAGLEGAIEVAPASRSVAALEYRFERGRRVAEPLAVFHSCRSDTPRFGGRGTVGPRTIWAGGLRIHRPGCVRLRVWVDGGRLPDVLIGAGRRCRG